MAISFGFAAVAPKLTRNSPVRIDSKGLSDLGKLLSQFRINVRVAKEEGDRVPLVLLLLDADSDMARDLRLANRLDNLIEFRVLTPQLAAGDGAVLDAD